MQKKVYLNILPADEITFDCECLRPFELANAHVGLPLSRAHTRAHVKHIKHISCFVFARVLKSFCLLDSGCRENAREKPVAEELL